MSMMDEALKGVDVIRVGGHEAVRATDVAAAEEPLEVRLNGRPFAVIMRTPGADPDLVAGFLLAEGVVRSSDELALIEHCRDASADARENTVNVTIVGGALSRLAAALDDRRQVVANAACGMCGRRQIESLRTVAPPIVSRARVAAAVVRLLPERLSSRQSAFRESGGLHAAALFTLGGEVDLTAEDVGRHNAVDKVIGRMLLRERLPLEHSLLFVSGRTSFEIVQKAVVAGIPIVAAVSAPSSLAVALANDMGVTLLGFVRDGRFNIYAHAGRIDPL
jgi:FdhD protein